MKQNWQETSRGGLKFGKSVEIENAGDGSGNEKGLDQGGKPCLGQVLTGCRGPVTTCQYCTV